MKIGVVDVGGGMRGIYACGALDKCMDDELTFDVCVGVSAGSGNLSTYISKQKNKNYRFYTIYSRREEFVRFNKAKEKGSLLDLNYIYNELNKTGGEDPFDFDTFKSNPAKFFVVATNALTGESVYFDKTDVQRDNYNIMIASSSIPYVCKPCIINGVPYYDGALGDPVPIKKAFDEGCDKVVLLLTRPLVKRTVSESDIEFSKKIEDEYPNAARAYVSRIDKYNESIELAKEYERQGKLLIVAPSDTCGVDTLSLDLERIKALYKKGYEDGAKIKAFCNY